MTKRIRDGLGFLCVAAVFLIASLAIDDAAFSDLLGFMAAFMAAVGLAAIAYDLFTTKATD